MAATHPARDVGTDQVTHADAMGRAIEAGQNSLQRRQHRIWFGAHLERLLDRMLQHVSHRLLHGHLTDRAQVVVAQIR